MKLLADWKLECDGKDRLIELYWGDLSHLPPEHAADILIVSAFRNDYMPTPTSLIGALERNGISVGRLSFAKEKDLRNEFGCWLSHTVGVTSFKRLLCVESGWQGSPPELADSIFRALVPISLSNAPTRIVAMPLIGAGDQGYPADQIMSAVLRSAVSWFRRGMPVEVLKIVAYSDASARQAKDAFQEIKLADTGSAPGEPQWDVFLSYSSKDLADAEHLHQMLLSNRKEIKVFRDKPVLQKGSSWLMQIAYAIDSSRYFLPLYSPSYWKSVVCRDELTAGYTRQVNSGSKLLFPIYYREANIPSFFQGLHYSDCREADRGKLSVACLEICKALG
jgi:hypothetical protein